MYIHAIEGVVCTCHCFYVHRKRDAFGRESRVATVPGMVIYGGVWCLVCAHVHVHAYTLNFNCTLPYLPGWAILGEL